MKKGERRRERGKGNEGAGKGDCIEELLDSGSKNLTTRTLFSLTAASVVVYTSRRSFMYMNVLL